MTSSPDVEQALDAIANPDVRLMATRFTRYLVDEDGRSHPAEVLAHPRVDGLVRIAMLPGRRSMNLSNAAAVATYEAWRQNGCAGASQPPAQA